MNKKQLEILQRNSKLRISDLEDVSDRTLLYGTLYDGRTINYCHLYIEGEMFHFTLYEWKSKKNFKLGDLKSFKYRDEMRSNMFLTNNTLSQEFKPECCDAEFCEYLKSKGIILIFRDIVEDVPTKKFYGIMFDELKNK